MGARDKMEKNALAFLEQGETLQFVIPAQRHMKGYSDAVLRGKPKWRCIVITDRRILILDAGKNPVKPRKVVRELPRSTLIGKPKGALWVTDALGERLRISKKSHKKVIAADASAD